MTLHLPDRDPVTGVHFVFVSNSSPWTYANAKPVCTNPDCRFETGLGVFGTTSMNVWRNLGLIRRMLSKRADIKAGHLVRDDDVAWLNVTSDTPIATQIDGDYLGLRESDAVPVRTAGPGRRRTPANTRLTCGDQIACWLMQSGAAWS